MVSCTSPNWKATKLRGTEDEDKDESKTKDSAEGISDENEVIDSDDSLKLMKSPAKKLRHEKSISPGSDWLQATPQKSPAKSVDEWLYSQSEKSPALQSPRKLVSKKLFELSAPKVTSHLQLYSGKRLLNFHSVTLV